MDVDHLSLVGFAKSWGLFYLIAMAIGVPVGLTAGYYRGALDQVIMRLTDAWLAFPFLILAIGLVYLEWRRRAALGKGEGYGDPDSLHNEPAAFGGDRLAHPLIALLPLLLVGVGNKLLSGWIPLWYGDSHSFDPAVIGSAAPVVQEIPKVAAIWSVQGALLVGILSVLALAGIPFGKWLRWMLPLQAVYLLVALALLAPPALMNWQ